MKSVTLTFLLCIAACFHAYAQTTYLIDTALVTDAGYGGAPASCKANGMTYNSVGMDRSHSVWAADAFTVPIGATWVFDTVILYGYQYGSSLSSPFTACNLQIYHGTPGSGGTVVWGDTTTNVLVSTTFTGIYKVDTFSTDNGLLSTKRPIMNLKLHLSPAPHLSAGTYWLAYSATNATVGSSVSTPFKVLPGRINPPAQSARVFASGSWQYVIDNGDTAGLNMIIKGSASLGVNSINEHEAETIYIQNAPNPFNNTTEIKYILPEEGHIKLEVYNALGQVVSVLVDGNRSIGEHIITFHANDLPCGFYYCRLLTPYGTASKQMLQLKN